MPKETPSDTPRHSPIISDGNQSMVGTTFYCDAYNAALEGKPNPGETPTHNYGYEQGLAEASRQELLKRIS